MDKKTREALFPEAGGDPIAPILKQLRERAPLSPGEPMVPEGTERKAEKREVYALIAYLLERSYPSVQRACESIEQSSYVYTEMLDSPDAKKVFAGMQPLRNFYMDGFQRGMKSWIASLDAPGNEYDRQVYERLQMLLRDKEIGVRERRSFFFILRGAHTASHVSWDMLAAIPLAFHQKYKRTITPEEYTQIAKQAEPLVILLSSVHLQSFANMNRVVEAKASFLARSTNLEFPMELFKIEERDGSYALTFDEQSLTRLDEHVRRQSRDPDEERRYGCPARDARVAGVAGRPMSMVSAVYRMYLSLAQTHLVPHLERYTQGGLELARDRLGV